MIAIDISDTPSWIEEEGTAHEIFPFYCKFINFFLSVFSISVNIKLVTLCDVIYIYI